MCEEKRDLNHYVCNSLNIVFPKKMDNSNAFSNLRVIKYFNDRGWHCKVNKTVQGAIRAQVVNLPHMDKIM